jgi:amino acid transporter
MSDTKNSIKKLGFASVTLLVINSIIGSGIFLTPDTIIKQAGQFTPVVYLFAAIFAIILGITFASAAKYVQTNGAAYAYTEAAFSKFKSTKYVGQYVGVTRWVTAAIAWGTASAFFVTVFLKIVNPVASSDANPNKTALLIGLFVLLLLILLTINLLGNKIVEIVSNTSTITKVSALLLFILVSAIAVISMASSGKSAELSANYNSANISSDNIVALIFAATVPALYAYTGFESVASASEEMKNPKKNLPRALIIGLLVVAAIYIATVSFAMLMGSGKIVQSKESIKLLEVVENPVVKSLITFGALVSIFGLNVAASFGSPRVLSALADNKQVPNIFSKKMSNGVPIYAFIATAIAAMIFPIALQFNTSSITQLSVISRFIQFILVPISVMILAKRIIKTDKSQYNFITDILIPILSLLLVGILLAYNDWSALVSIKDKAGVVSTNFISIGSMLLLFVILPFVMIILRRSGKFSK